MAAIHTKLDQLIAVYTTANTPRSGTTPASIFSTASDTHAAPSLHAQLSTAESILPGGKAAAAAASTGAAHHNARAVADTDASPKGRGLADAEEEAEAAAAAEPVVTTPKVRFSLADLSSADKASSADTGQDAALASAAAAAEAASTEVALQTVPRVSAWSRLRAKAASSAADTDDSSPLARPAGMITAPFVRKSSLKAARAAVPGRISNAALQSGQPSEANVAPEAASAAAVTAGASPPADTISAPVPAPEADAAATQPLFRPDAKPRSSLKQMLQRVMH